MDNHQARLQTPLGRVRGHGSARNGTHHWWMQRVTSFALLPLTIWFVFSVAARAGAPWEVMAEWIGRPINAVLLIAMIAVGFHHTAAGLQVIVEDYVRPERNVAFANLAIKGVLGLGGLLSVLSIIRLAV